jgi:acyl carrier protein
VIEVLGFDSRYPLDPERGLFDLGMDSLTAVELKNRLQTALGRPLPSTLLFDHPNVRKLSNYLAGEVLHWSDTTQDGDDSQGENREAGPLDAYSEDQLAELLARKLEQLQ